MALLRIFLGFMYCEDQETLSFDETMKFNDKIGQVTEVKVDSKWYKVLRTVFSSESLKGEKVIVSDRGSRQSIELSTPLMHQALESVNESCRSYYYC